MNPSHISRYPVTIDGETAQIGTANELAIALDVLHGRHDRSILEQLRPHLTAIVGGPVGFTNVMRSLEPENQLYLIDAMGDQLAQVLQQTRYLRDLLATLAVAEVEQRLIETLGGAGLRALIVTAPDLAQVLEWIYGRSDQRVLDLLGADYVRAIIRTGKDLGLVLDALEASAQVALIGKIGWARVVELVRDGHDLAYLVRALPPAESAALLDQFSREQMIGLIGNKIDWAYLYDRLEPAEVTNVLNKIGGK